MRETTCQAVASINFRLPTYIHIYIYLYTYINVGGNYERKPNRSARASTIRYRSTRCMHQRKEPLSSFVPFFRLLFFFPSFFFPFLSPSFISCPPSCSPRQPFSFFLLFLFFFSFTRATVHGIIDGAMNTRTPLRFFRVTPSLHLTLPPSFVFNFLPRLPFTVRWHFEFAASFVRDVFARMHVRY